jgi:hypothetical protein
MDPLGSWTIWQLLVIATATSVSVSRTTGVGNSINTSEISEKYAKIQPMSSASEAERKDGNKFSRFF